MKNKDYIKKGIGKTLNAGNLSISNNSNSSNEKRLASKLRTAKAQKQNGVGINNGKLKTIRQAKSAKRQKNKKLVKSKGVAIKKTNLLNKTTSSALRAAWMNIIPSLGLSFLYIPIHVFLSAVLGRRVFCRLGEEWFFEASGNPDIESKIAKANLIEKVVVSILIFAVLVLMMGVLGLLVIIIDNFSVWGITKHIIGIPIGGVKSLVMWGWHGGASMIGK